MFSFSLEVDQLAVGDAIEAIEAWVEPIFRHLPLPPAIVALNDVDRPTFLATILFAAWESTAHTLTTAIWSAATHGWPQPAECDGFVAETVRLFPPVSAVLRIAETDTMLADTEIPAGSRAFIAVAATSAAPTRWQSPSTFDPHREPSRTHAFGGGRHLCPGRQPVLYATARLLDALEPFRATIHQCDGWTHPRGLVRPGDFSIVINN
jgi:hypothetical protein